jgi:hypothetical protein
MKGRVDEAVALFTRPQIPGDFMEKMSVLIPIILIPDPVIDGFHDQSIEEVVFIGDSQGLDGQERNTPNELPPDR